jgi:hypothetical protein
MGTRTVGGLPKAENLSGNRIISNSTRARGPSLAVCGALIQEQLKGPEVIQHPVYYISEALAGAKLNYSELEKITYAVLISSRKLKHYF